MNFLYLFAGLLMSIVGVILAVRRNFEVRKRAVGGIFVVVGIIAIIYSFFWSPQAMLRKYIEAGDRQGYVTGYGLGEYLKINQPGHQLAIVRVIPDSSHNRQVIKGLKDGLGGFLIIVAEPEIDISRVETHQEAAALLTRNLMSDLKSSGADIVVSFNGIPLGVLGGAYDVDATKELWRTPEYRALKWVLPRPPEIWVTGSFKDGNVLAVIQERPQEIPLKGFPPHLKIRGTPAELFNAWFEVVTTDEGIER